MARPTVKDQRRTEILDAFEICVARSGVEGATLAKTAEQAGLARALIRHNVGNREDLLGALVERFLDQSRQATEQMIEALPQSGRSETLVGWLFDPRYSDPKTVRVAGALIAASAEDKALAKHMQGWLNDFVGALDGVFAEEYANASPEQVLAIAAGITGIYFNVEALYPLGDVEALSKASERAAFLLLASLEAGA